MSKSLRYLIFLDRFNYTLLVHLVTPSPLQYIVNCLFKFVHASTPPIPTVDASNSHPAMSTPLSPTLGGYSSSIAACFEIPPKSLDDNWRISSYAVSVSVWMFS